MGEKQTLIYVKWNSTFSFNSSSQTIDSSSSSLLTTVGELTVNTHGPGVRDAIIKYKCTEENSLQFHQLKSASRHTIEFDARCSKPVYTWSFHAF